jgi:hypothetical protein
VEVVRALVVSVGALALLALGAGTAKSGTSASRTVDRTFLCRLSLPNVDLQASAGIRYADNRSRWKKLASAYASTNQGSLAWIRAGAPLPPPTELGATPDTVLIDIDQCLAWKASVPLTPRGLSGGAADQFGDPFECIAPKRLLVRVRATFRSPAVLRSRSGSFGGVRWKSLTANVPLREAQLGVGTLAGKRIAYAEVFESGKSRIFTAPACTPG